MVLRFSWMDCKNVRKKGFRRVSCYFTINYLLASMSDKSTVLKAFNNLFFEFVEDIILIFPENEDLKYAKKAMEMLRKANPICIIKAWNKYVVLRYKDVIFSGDISFFFDKDYRDDLSRMSNPDEIMKSIDKIREPIKQMGPENKEHATKYIQNLCKLAELYWNM